MAKTLRVVPAYCRDYKSAEAVEADWKAGKDFQIRNHFDPDDGRYVNIKDAPDHDVIVRYDQLRKVTTIKAAKKGPSA